MIKKQKDYFIKNLPQEQVVNFYRHQLYDLKVQEESNEWDSIIVVPGSKMIINIEVKTGNSGETLKSASKQTKKHNIFFTKVFGCVLSEDWKFLRSVCMPYYKFDEVSTLPCKQCKKFIIGTRELSDVKKWIQQFVAVDIKPTNESCQNEYEDLISRLIGFTSIQKSFEINKLLAKPTDYRKDVEKRLTGENSGLSGEGCFNDRYELVNKMDQINKISKFTLKIAQDCEFNCYMLTFQQLNALKYSAQILIIVGDYGSGKTFVLKERAKLHATKYPDEKIVYISLTNFTPSFPGTDECFSVMDFYAKNDFRDFSNIDVITSKHIAQYIQENMHKGYDDYPRIKRIHSAIKHFLDNHEYDAIFIDELLLEYYMISEQSFGGLPTDKTICVTVMILDQGIKHFYYFLILYLGSCRRHLFAIIV